MPGPFLISLLVLLGSGHDMQRHDCETPAGCVAVIAAREWDGALPHGAPVTAELARALEMALGSSTGKDDEVRRRRWLQALVAVSRATEGERAALSASLRLGRHLLDRSAFRDAEGVCAEVQEAAAVLGDARLEADAWIGLSDARRSLDRYQEALKAAAHAERLARGTPATSDVLLRALNARGVAARNLGQFEQAAHAYEEAIALAPATASLPTVARSWNNLGVIRAMQADYRAALTAFRKSLHLREAAGDSLGIAQSLTNIAGVHREQGQLDLAADYLSRALAQRELLGDRLGEATSAYTLGEVEHLRGRSAPADTLLARAHALAMSVDSLGLAAEVREAMGMVALDGGRLPAARQALEEAVAVARRLESPVRLASALVNLARTARRQGDGREASEALNEAGPLTEALLLQDLRWQVLHERGALALGRGETAVARGLFEQAAAAVETVRAASSGDVHGLTGIFAQRQAPLRALVDLLASDGELVSAFERSEQARARGLQDLLRSGRVSPSRLTEAQRRERDRAEHRRATLRAAFERAQSRADVDSSEVRVLEQAVNAAVADLVALDAAHAANAPASRPAPGDPVGTTLDVERLPVPPRGALVSYTVSESRVWAFTVVRDAAAILRLHARPLAVAPDVLRHQAHAFRAMIARRDPNFAMAARTLHAALLGPVADLLRGVDHLVVCPDEMLWEVPFAALQPDVGRPLAERLTVSYITSLDVWHAQVENRPPPSAQVRLLAIGAPQASPPDPALAETGLLLRGLARTYGAAAEVLRGAHATEANLRDRAGRHAIVHIATHGRVDAAFPLYSYLQLTPTADDDGRLEARELLGLDLSTPLLVLSACDTARGAVLRGEGVLGLAWAATQARAGAVVVSQWRVDAASTSALMLRLHRELRRGRSPAEALARAMRVVARDARYRHPFYWAGFTAIGAAHHPLSGVRRASD